MKSHYISKSSQVLCALYAQYSEAPHHCPHYLDTITVYVCFTIWIYRHGFRQATIFPEQGRFCVFYYGFILQRVKHQQGFVLERDRGKV